MNDMFMGFKDISSSYDNARHMERVVVNAVLQLFDNVAYTHVDSICGIQKIIHVLAQVQDRKVMEKTFAYQKLHQDGDIFFKSTVASGNIAIIGLSSEHFTGIGCALKKTHGWTMLLPC